MVNISTGDGKLNMEISDNGTGFDKSVNAYGNGLANMQQRAAFWNDTLTIQSMPGKGTSITLELHLAGT
ncbi:nitrate/nitrite sensor protein NarQ [compost metagenome]